MLDFFQFYNIPVSFILDEAALHKQYLQFSKEFHPDFYALADETEQARVLELSSFNNEAYKTLSDKDKRMAYILKLKGLLDEDHTKTQIPADFLMEMMELNEQLMELEFDFDAASLVKLNSAFNSKKEALFNQILPLLENYEDGASSGQVLDQILIYYLKMRYINRLEENLQALELKHR